MEMMVSCSRTSCEGAWVTLFFSFYFSQWKLIELSLSASLSSTFILIQKFQTCTVGTEQCDRELGWSRWDQRLKLLRDCTSLAWAWPGFFNQPGDPNVNSPASIRRHRCVKMKWHGNMWKLLVACCVPELLSLGSGTSVWSPEQLHWN